MTTYLVWPLDDYAEQVYVGHTYALADGHLVEGGQITTEEQAARAVLSPYKRRAVLGPDGLVVIDLAPVDGRETLSLDEGPHR